MHKIQGVSLPRSGHNMLVDHLQSYFRSHNVCSGSRTRKIGLLKKLKQHALLRRDHAANKSDSTQSAKTKHAMQPAATVLDRSPEAFHYCEYYYTCRTVPCIDASNAFQKSHDFELDQPIETNRRFLIQTRNAIALLLSWFELRLKKNRESDSQAGFDAFVARQNSYISGFQRKWIDNDLPNRLILDYDDYMTRPAALLHRTIEFFVPEQPIDDGLVANIVQNVRPPKDIRDFRFTPANLEISTSR